MPHPFRKPLLLALPLCAAAAFAQGTAPAKGAAPAAAPAGQAAPAQGATAQPAPEDFATIKQTVYHPTLERDPFATPADDVSKAGGDTVDDISVKGVVKFGGKIFAVVYDSRGRTQRLEVGHKFKDGEIAAIDDHSVTFHQWDVNSTIHSAYRKVVKTFKREEGKK